jgi:uncharacterized membrane protein YdjX (TVP38/TMEM64 family)
MDRISTGRWRILIRVIALFFVIGLSGSIFIFREQAATLGKYGYAGAFLFSLLTSATLILPVPGLLIVFSMGAVFNPFWIAVAAAAGAAIGELSGYLAGYTGRVVVENTQTYERLREWMENNKRLSSWMIMVVSFLPLPFIDLAGMAAGALQMPLIRFLWWCWLGKIPRTLLAAYLGSKSLDILGIFGL